VSADLIQLLVSRLQAVANPHAEALEIAAATEDAEAPALALAERRAAGEPLAYVTGRVCFMGLPLYAGPGALVPRAETELLGNVAVEFLRGRAPAGAGQRLLDVCCGSGNLVCGIAAALLQLQAFACDLTEGAMALCRRNVASLGLGSRTEVRQGDLFAALEGLALEGTLDLIVCNPPYISTGRLAKDRAGLLAYEPREAFDGGPYGLTIHQRVVREAPRFLCPGGALAFEVGLGQEKQVLALFQRSNAFGPPELRHDSAGLSRVVLARVP
jgi:release factor glutamine methyltransferase